MSLTFQHRGSPPLAYCAPRASLHLMQMGCMAACRQALCLLQVDPITLLWWG